MIKRIMDMQERHKEIEHLYKQAFAQYGAVALWNMRPVEHPTPGAALAITAALRTHGSMDGRRLAEHIERLCCALSKLQSHILLILAGQRSPDSYIAGAIAINRDGPRFSGAIDIFQDGDERLAAIAENDAAIMTEAGLHLNWLSSRGGGKRTALVDGLDEQTQLEWVADSDFRFFPAQPDDMFGYVLHPADLATNKASAAADRRVPRDIVDLVTIHERILPLGAVVTAAVGRFPGMTPEGMLSDIRRHSTFTADEFQSLATERPIDIKQLHKQIKAMLDAAEDFIAQLPSDALGFLFLDEAGKPVQPDPGALDRYNRRGADTGLPPRRSARLCWSGTINDSVPLPMTIKDTKPSPRPIS